MKVKLIKTKSNFNSEFQINGLSVGNIYEVLAYSNKTYRILNDIDNLPYVYPIDCFEVMDFSEPNFWIEKSYDNNKFEKFPKEWELEGFFCDFHDDVEEVRFLFYKVCKELYKIDVKLSMNDIPIHVWDGKNIFDRFRPCLKKTWYLEPTESENIYKFIYEYPENINLTIGKEYKIQQRKDIWYKVIDDIGKEIYFPIYMFEEVKYTGL